MTVVALDDTDRDLVLRVFERLTGLAPGTLIAEPDSANRSMTVPEIEVLREFNKRFRDEKLPAPLYGRIIRFGAAAYMRTRTPAPDEDRIELPQWAIEPVSALSSEMMATIRASGVHVIGDLDHLAVATTTRAPGDQPVSITPAIASSAAMGVLLASGLARGTGTITAKESEGVQGDEAFPRAPRPVQEPPELLRISTLQIGVVLVRRARAFAFGQLDRLKFWRGLRRRR
jgi:hypothetical protein